jgi:Tol biopolymer transport system component
MTLGLGCLPPRLSGLPTILVFRTLRRCRPTASWWLTPPTAPKKGKGIRLTFDGLRNTSPNFSPDGSRIVFESQRDGGGIYEIPALGGQARLLARGGLEPMYSPDGSQAAYWVGTPSVALAVPGTGAAWVIPVAGGPPRRVAPILTDARWPFWSPDGNRLLLSGYSSEALRPHRHRLVARRCKRRCSDQNRHVRCPGPGRIARGGLRRQLGNDCADRSSSNSRLLVVC